MGSEDISSHIDILSRKDIEVNGRRFNRKKRASKTTIISNPDDFIVWFYNSEKRVVEEMRR